MTQFISRSSSIILIHNERVFILLNNIHCDYQYTTSHVINKDVPFKGKYKSFDSMVTFHSITPNKIKCDSGMLYNSYVIVVSVSLKNAILKAHS